RTACICLNAGKYSFARLLVFFQAEDAIRDLTVTGVQTCALPISGGPHADELERLPRPAACGPPELEARGSVPADEDVLEHGHREIGRASCREREPRSGQAAPLQTKKTRCPFDRTVAM